jgi:hypothetical protein
MRPQLPVHDQAHIASSQAKLRADLALQPVSGSVESPDLDDVSLGQFGCSIPSSMPKFRVSPQVVIIPVRHAPLGHSITRILNRRPEPQVFRITAQPLVTCVTNEERRGIYSVPQQEGDAMRSHGAPASNVLPISVVVPIALPEPALRIGAAVDLRPEFSFFLRGKLGKRDTISISHKASMKGFIGQDRETLQHVTRSVLLSQEGA